MAPAPMPVRYVVEMMMDRIAASKVYLKDQYTDSAPLEYFQKGIDCAMHPKTKKQLYILLKMLSTEGEENTFWFVKHVVLNK